MLIKGLRGDGTMIPYGRQSINQADIDAVVEVLHSQFLTQGPAVPRFEQAIAAYCGSAYGVAANSATSALHIACLALGVGPGDLVWTSPITFVASANCALYCGAEVDFVDIDPRSYNMSAEKLAEKLAVAERAGRLPKVVIPVHMGGQSCAMAEFHDLALRYGFRIIEDASHAIGASYRDAPVGDCRYSDITVFSFHPVKIITTAEGGLALTNSAELAEAMALYRSHGVTRDPHRMEREPDGGWYYEQLTLGYNYRMTDMQAALGLAQASRLDEFVDRRRSLAKRYDEALTSDLLTLPWQAPDTLSSYHLYIVRLDGKHSSIGHRAAYDQLREQGIGVNLHYMPVYLQPYYRRLGFVEGHCPQSERYYSEAISLPIFAGLTEQEQEQVIRAVGNVVAVA